MKKTICLLLLVATACAAPSRVDQMVPKFSAPGIASSDTRYESVSLVSSTIDKVKFPYWYTTVSDASLALALRKTLDGRALLAQGQSPGKYALAVSLVGFKRPPIQNLDQATTFGIRYELREAATGKPILMETISTTGSESYSKDKNVDDQARIAAELAMQKNFSQFVDKLNAALGPAQVKPDNTKAKILRPKANPKTP